MADPQLQSLYLNLVGNPGSISGHTYDTLPDDDDITLTAGAANVLGTAVEIATSVGAADVWLCGFYCTNMSAADDGKVQLASGAGNGTARAVVPYTRTDQSAASLQFGVMTSWPFPIRITNGTRLVSQYKEGGGSGTIDVVSWHATGLVG